VQLGAMLSWEGHVSQDVGLGFIHHPGELGDLRPDLVSDEAPLPFGRLGVVLSEGGGDEGGDDAATLAAGMGEHIAHEVDPATLPGRAEHLGDRRLDAFVSIGDDQLDPCRPRRVSFLRKVVQKGSASDGPISSPRTSRRPSLLTPTATITATETMRPAWRTFT